METGQRERWSGRTAFIMAAIGSAVGLGNLWRFPATAFKCGGGAFLIPYFVALVTAGIPLMIVEYALGQKYQGGAPQALAAVTKRFRWVGWFALLVASVICMYYVVVMAYAWRYCVASTNLAWTEPVSFVEVTEDEAGKPVVNRVDAKNIVLYVQASDEAARDRLAEAQEARESGLQLPVLTAKDARRKQAEEGGEIRYVPLAENVANFFNEDCLGGFHPDAWALRDDVDDAALPVDEMGSIDADALQRYRLLKGRVEGERSTMFRFTPGLVAGAALTWFLIFLIIFRGVRNVGRIVMFTVPLPVILLLVLLIRGITLEGAVDGILYFLTPNWEMLKDPGIWIKAYAQIFFSLTLGFGVLIAYASYMPQDSDVTGNAFITSFGNCATSFLAGLAVFSVLGYLAHVSGSAVGDVVEGGPGLVFVTYPIALTKMPMGLWAIRILAVLFFVCLISLGIDSAFSLVEGLVTGFRDAATRLSKPLLTAVFCVVGFAGSLLVCTRSGMMWLDILDNWTNNYGLALVGLLECVAVGYFFRLDELKDYINRHSEIKVHYWFDACVKFITPAILLFLLGQQFLGDIASTYEGYDAVLRHAVTGAGWGMFLGVFVLALILGRNWRTLTWVGAMAAVTLVFYGYFSWQLPPQSSARILAPAVMGGVGAVLLFGGLFTAIAIARRSHRLAGLSQEGMAPTEDDYTQDEPTESELETQM